MEEQAGRLRAAEIDDEENRERRTRWWEMFYDLVFVALIAEFGAALARDPSWTGVRHFLLPAAAAIWVWAGAALYDDRFATDNAVQRSFAFLKLLPVAGMALAVHGGVAERSRLFAAAFVAARLIQIFQWRRAGRRNPFAGPLARRTEAGAAIAAVLWTISLLTPSPARYGLWIAGLVVDLATPFATLFMQIRLPRTGPSQLAERFGLFTLIVFGAAAAGVVRGLAAAEQPTAGTALAAGLGLALIFVLWWLYFDHATRRTQRSGVWSTLVWMYLHLPLYLGATVVGAAALSIAGGDSESPPASLRWAICLATAALMIAIDAMEASLPREEGEPRAPRWVTAYRLAGAVAALLIGVEGGSLGGAALMACLTVVGASQILYARRGWIWRSAS